MKECKAKCTEKGVADGKKGGILYGKREDATVTSTAYLLITISAFTLEKIAFFYPFAYPYVIDTFERIHSL